MDTSTIAAMMKQEIGITPTAFTAAFGVDNFDETADAVAVASALGLPHVVTQITERHLEDIPDIVALYDQPVGDQSVLAEYVLCKVASAMGITALTTGEGGDEVLGFPRARDSQESFADLPMANADLAAYYLSLTATANETVRHILIHQLNTNTADPAVRYLQGLYDSLGHFAPFERLYFGQWRTWMIEDVFMKDSQLAKGWNMQLILPFMDIHLLTFAAELSVADKRAYLHDKSGLRLIMRDSLPDAVLSKPKHKFWLPLASWFRHASYEFLHDTLLAQNSLAASVASRQSISQILEEHRVGRSDHYRILWSMLVLTVWYNGLRGG